jgi:hypothetical protein
MRLALQFAEVEQIDLLYVEHIKRRVAREGLTGAREGLTGTYVKFGKLAGHLPNLPNLTYVPIQLRISSPTTWRR